MLRAAAHCKERRGVGGAGTRRAAQHLEPVRVCEGSRKVSFIPLNEFQQRLMAKDPGETCQIGILLNGVKSFPNWFVEMESQIFQNPRGVPDFYKNPDRTTLNV